MTIEHTMYKRSEMYQNGMLAIQDLDNEELAFGQFRDDTKQVSPEVRAAFARELCERADKLLLESMLDAVATMTEICSGDAYEPQDRIKAATWLYERVRGKNPDTVIYTQDKPWEQVLLNIDGGSRAESRARRGVPDPQESTSPGVIDVDIDAEQDPPTQPEPVTRLGFPPAHTGFVAPDPPYVGDPEKGEPTQKQEHLVYRHGPEGDGKIHTDVMPPQDPDLRQRYEDQRAAEKKAARDVLKERVQKAHALRIAAREGGHSRVSLPKRGEVRRIKPVGVDPVTKEMVYLKFVTWREPTPEELGITPQKLSGQRRQNARRRRADGG